MKRILNWLLLLGFVGMATAQEPIIRVKQIGTWSTPAMWWKGSVTQDLDDFLAQDVSKPAEDNNNFDIWRDKVLEMEVTLDDKGADVTTFRIDIAFDNDLITWIEDGESSVNAWSQGESRVIKGSHIAGLVEGDETSNNDTDYSFEVVHYSNVSYQDSLAATGNLIEESIPDNRYDWLRITMVSHGVDANNDGTPDVTFGDGNGVQAQVLKFKFKINDVVDNFAPKSFRVATQYDGAEGYYTYVSDEYLLDYKVYIDGNWGDTYPAERTYNGAARGDITLHPKLVEIEGYYRYIGEWLDEDNQGNVRGEKDDDEEFSRNKYAMWKVVFELDESNPDDFSNWLNLRDINYPSSLTDEGTTDDVMGTYDEYAGNALGYQHMRHYEQSAASTSDQGIQDDGFNGVSFWYWTYTDNKGYFNISLPRNNRYRVSFWPPDSDDIVGDHTTYLLDRDAITNINDAIAGFNFQSNKFDNDPNNIEIESPSGYLVGDVDGDDKYQLNDSYFLWAYTSGVFDTEYTHFNGETYQSWASIDNLKTGNNSETLNYYQTVNGSSRLQKREFSIFVDDDLNQENAELTTDQGGIIRFNPLMDDVQTGLDTLSIKVGAGSSTFGDDQNPDYYFDAPDGQGSKQIDIIGTDNDSDIGYYFTGDVNLTGTLVDNDGSAVTPPVDGTTFYRWGDSPPDTWARIGGIGDGDRSMSAMKSLMTDHDVTLSFPADSTVRVQSGEIIEVPLKITPTEGINIAGFEFEVEFNVNELTFIDMKTGNLPGPWMTYVNVGEVEEGWQRVRFGGFDYSPGNAPTNYWVTEQMNALKLMFRAEFPDEEWSEAPIRFVGKYAAGNPNGDDLKMERLSGKVMVWNKYWAFGGGEPGEEDITYNYPNPFKENTKFQFYLDEMEQVKIYILNSNGQYIGTLLDEVVDAGIHTFDFTNQPSVWLPEVSVYENHQTLEPGVYIFVLQTDDRIKANKFTVVK